MADVNDRGNHARALELYEAAYSERVRDMQHLQLCKAGIARTAIRTGDLKKCAVSSFFLLFCVRAAAALFAAARSSPTLS